MAIVTYLDSEQKLSEQERSALVEAEQLLGQGDFAGAEAALRPLATSGRPEIQGYTELLSGDMSDLQMEVSSALRHYQRAGQQFASAGQNRGTIFATYRQAMIQVDEDADGGKTGAIQQFTTSFDEAAQLNDQFLIAYGHHYKGYFAVGEGRHQEAAGELQQAIDIRDRIGDEDHLLSSKALLALCLGELGDYARARQLAEEAFQAQTRKGLRANALKTLNIMSYVSRKETPSADVGGYLINAASQFSSIAFKGPSFYGASSFVALSPVFSPRQFRGVLLLP